jgi:hypothetical protein
MIPVTFFPHQNDCTALQKAARNGKTTTVKLLVSKGAIVDKTDSVRRNLNPKKSPDFLCIFLVIFSTENLLNRARCLSVIGNRFDFQIAFLLFEKTKDISGRN